MKTLALPPVDPDRLRDALRSRLDAPALDFDEPPRFLASGGEAVIDAFSLREVPEELAGPLVLRRLLPLREPAQLRLEAAVHATLVRQEYPVPSVHCVETDAAAIGAPFLVADRVPGKVMLEAVTEPQVMARQPWRFPGLIFDALYDVPWLLAMAQAWLHDLDPEPLRAELRGAGLDPGTIGFDARLAEVHRWVEEARLDGLRPGLDWLAAERPAAAREVICHGDFVFTNLCVDGGRVSGVFDWARVTLAEKAYDVAASRARLESRVPGLPGAVDWLTRTVQGKMVDRYQSWYAKDQTVEPERLRYYEAFWLVYELAWSGQRLRAGARASDAIEHRWLHPETLEHGVAEFRRHTGVTLAPLRPADA